MKVTLTSKEQDFSLNDSFSHFHGKFPCQLRFPESNMLQIVSKRLRAVNLTVKGQGGKWPKVTQTDVELEFEAHFKEHLKFSLCWWYLLCDKQLFTFIFVKRLAK